MGPAAAACVGNSLNKYKLNFIMIIRDANLMKKFMEDYFFFCLNRDVISL